MGANGHSANGTIGAAALREQLERVLASPEFRNSKRHSAFLRYVVEEALDGNAALLKERSIGVAVFGLDPAYDTSLNPVVRVSAGELRKRLVQYYGAPERAAEVRIELAPGSYAPAFCGPLPGAPAPAAVPVPGVRPGWLIAAALALCAIVLLGLALWLKPWAPRGAFEQFWAPIWESPGRASVVVAAHAFPGQDGAPGPVSLQPDDAFGVARLTPVLALHNKEFQILLQPSTTLADLQRGPAILVAAFTNELSMRLMGEARFTFEMDRGDAQPKAAVRDRQKPADRQWRLERRPGGPPGEYTDYAIVSRVRDPATGHAAVVAGGITAPATRAVCEFLGSAKAMSIIPAAVARAWRGKNLQIVLAIRIIPGSDAVPSVLTTYSW